MNTLYYILLICRRQLPGLKVNITATWLVGGQLGQEGWVGGLGVNDWGSQKNKKKSMSDLKHNSFDLPRFEIPTQSLI